MLKILFTLILLAIVIYGIVKKTNIATVLLFATVIGYLCLTLVTGTSMAGEDTIGNRFLDIFEVINSSMVKAMTGNILTAMVMISYYYDSAAGDALSCAACSGMFEAYLCYRDSVTYCGADQSRTGGILQCAQSYGNGRVRAALVCEDSAAGGRCYGGSDDASLCDHQQIF